MTRSFYNLGRNREGLPVRMSRRSANAAQFLVHDGSRSNLGPYGLCRAANIALDLVAPDERTDDAAELIRELWDGT